MSIERMPGPQETPGQGGRRGYMQTAQSLQAGEVSGARGEADKNQI